MADIDEEIGASLRRLGPEPSADGVLDLVTRRRDRLVRRRRAITVVATVAVVAVLGGAIAVAASPDQDPDRVVVDSPTTPLRSTTTTTASTSTTTTSTTTSTSTTTTTTAPVDTAACVPEAVATSIGAPTGFIVDGPECVGSFAVATICDPVEGDSCGIEQTILSLVDGRWTIVGHALDGCLEHLAVHMSEPTALRFQSYLWCARPWEELLEPAVLEPGGLGPVRIGMTVAELEAATRMRVGVPEGDDSVGIGDCRWVGLGSTSDAVSLIVRAPVGTAPADLHRVAVVVSIFGFLGPTHRGIGLSDPQDAVLEAYPDAEVQPNVWSQPDGLWISWPARDHPQAITFETNGSQVTNVHAGRHMPEGCHP